MSAPLRVEVLPADAVPAPAWERADPGGGTDDAPAPGWSALLAYRGTEPVARLAAGIADGLARAPGRTGMIGWYAARDAEAGTELLRRAVDLLGESDPARVVGPIDGSTWGRYRLALPSPPKRDPGPPFLTEPTNPPGYPEHFAAAGLAPLWEYESRLVRRPGAIGADPLPAGVRLRPLDPARLEAELRAIHALSLEAFADNLLYSPIAFAPFAATYERMLPLLDPSLVLLATNGNEALGYVFAFPDPLAPVGRSRVVLKTLAVAPSARGSGLGGALTGTVHRAAAARGAEVIHALMLVTNVSTRISERHGAELFRRYLLFGREGG